MNGDRLTKPTDGIVSRYLNRRISTRITKYLVENDVNITPTQVSIISFILGILSAILYFTGYIIYGGILIQISSIIDGVDGELARARNLVSRLGGFTDTFLDRLVNISVFLSISYYLTILYPTNGIVLLITLVALSGDLMVSYLHSIAQKDLSIHPAKVGSLPPIASRDVRLFILFLFSLLYSMEKDMILYGLLLIGIISYTYVGVKFIELIRNYQEE